MITTRAALDDEGVLVIVETADYERLKRPGVGAPAPDMRNAYLMPDTGRDPDDRLFVRYGPDGEWEQIEWPSVVLALAPGDAIRVESRPRVMIGGFI